MRKTRLFMIFGVLLLSLVVVGMALAQDNGSDATGSRSGSTDSTPPIVYNSTASFSQGFDDINNLPGWNMQNKSDPLGVTNWFQGSSGVFPAQAGADTAYIAANFNNVSGVGTISNWLLTPPLTLGNGATFSFWTRKVAGSTYPDRLQVRLSTAGDSTNVGTTAESVGDFTTLLLDINPNLTVSGYPTVWTQYTLNISGIPMATLGRIAFRYYVTNGGSSGTNSDYIGIDTVEYIDPPLDIQVTPSALNAVQLTNQTTVQNVQICNTGGGTVNWVISDAASAINQLISLPFTLGPAQEGYYPPIQASDLPAVPLAPEAVDSTYADESVPDNAPATEAAGVENSVAGEPFNAPQSVLWNNGPLVTHPGGGAGGADASALQTALGMNSYGFSDNGTYRLADEFIISDPAGWNIESFTFFAYQTGSTTACTINQVNYRIWNGPPNNPGSAVVFGDTSTNRLLSCAFSDIYRVLDTALTNTQRPVMAVTASAYVTLPPGAYWLDWQTAGTLASGPFVPPITILGQTTTGNALQFNGTSWAAVTDVGTQGMPFVVSGYVDLPWLDETPKSGALLAGRCTLVATTFKSTGLAIGTYNGSLKISSNDPDESLVSLPVTMKVVASPDIQVTPTSLSSIQAPDKVTTSPLQICDASGGPLNWVISENATVTSSNISIPAFEGTIPESDVPASAGPAPYVNPGDSNTLLAFPLAGEPAFAMQTFPQINLVHFPNTTNPGNWTVVAPEPSTQFFAGDFVNGNFSILYVLSYDQNKLIAINTVTGGQTVIGNSAPAATEVWTGMSGARDGTMYASSTNVTRSTLYTINLATGVPTVIGQITNAPGIIDIAIAPNGTLYGVDILNDKLIRINRATGEGTVVGSIGFDANFAQGMDFEENSGVLYMAAFNNNLFRGELRIVDTTTGNTSLVGPFPGGSEVDALAFTTDGKPVIPWLSENPTVGTIQPGACQTINVNFNSTGLGLGTYHGELIITTNDPDELSVKVPVTLKVIYMSNLPIVRK